MKTSVHIKIAPMLWKWVTKRSRTAGSKIAVVEQAITEMKAREDAQRPPQAVQSIPLASILLPKAPEEIHRSKRQDAKREKPE